MATEPLGTLDLDKLTALQALLHHENVSAAARALGVAQPSLSHTLAAMRRVFADPLLVRSGNRMVPTAKGLALRDRIAIAITALRSLGAEERFEPEEATHRWKIACTDYIAGLIMPPLLQRLRTRAPGIALELQNWGTRHADVLATDALDLGIGTEARRVAGLYQRTLFEESFVCVADARNRKASRRLTPEGFAALPHVQLTVKGVGTGAVDRALGGLGLSRRVVLSLPHFWLAPNFIADTDLVLTVPRRLACLLAPRYPGLKTIPVPLDLPSFAVTLLWHERLHHEPAHRWIREQIVDVTRELQADTPRTRSK